MKKAPNKGTIEYLKKHAPKLSFWNNLHIDLYNRCLRPMDQSIDWPSFFEWAKIKGVPNIEESADYLLFMRNELNKETDNIRKIEDNKPKNEFKKSNAFEEKLKQKKLEKEKNNTSIITENKPLSKKDIDSILKNSGKFG